MQIKPDSLTFLVKRKQLEHYVLLDRPHTLRGGHTTRHTFHSEIGAHSVLRVADKVLQTDELWWTRRRVLCRSSRRITRSFEQWQRAKLSHASHSWKRAVEWWSASCALGKLVMKTWRRKSCDILKLTVSSIQSSFNATKDEYHWRVQKSCTRTKRENSVEIHAKTSHQSNGFVEAVHRHFQGLARCYQTQIETCACGQCQVRQGFFNFDIFTFLHVWHVWHDWHVDISIWHSDIWHMCVFFLCFFDIFQFSKIFHLYVFSHFDIFDIFALFFNWTFLTCFTFLNFLNFALFCTFTFFIFFFKKHICNLDIVFFLNSKLLHVHIFTFFHLDFFFILTFFEKFSLFEHFFHFEHFWRDKKLSIV